MSRGKTDGLILNLDIILRNIVASNYHGIVQMKNIFSYTVCISF